MCDSEMEIDHNKYEACCLFDIFHDCGPTSQTQQRKNLDWPDSCVDFGTLSNIDVTPYLISLGMVSNSQGHMIMSEKQLIMNRIASYTSTNRNSTVICPLHRYTYGIYWKQNKKCGHPDHPPTRRIPRADCRRAKLDVAKNIPEFIYGSRLCSKHRQIFDKSDLYDKNVPIIDEHDDFTISNLSDFYDDKILSINDDDKILSINDDDKSTISNFIDEENTSRNGIKRSQFNAIFYGTSVSPLKSSTTKPLEEQSDASKRRLVSKYKRGLQSLQEEYAEAIAPTQGHKLIRLAEESNKRAKVSYEEETESNIVEQLRLMYQAFVTHRVPFREQVQLLSLLPSSWSIEKIMFDFNCSSHAVKLAKKIRKNSDYTIEYEPDGVQHRQRRDPSVTKHFISCQQHALAGIDEFVNDGIEGWNVLKDMIEKFSIPQTEKKRLQKQVDMGILYQKHGYSQHCEEHAMCSYHCINFALSDPTIKEFQSSCSTQHTERCTECDNILFTLAEIEYHISNVIDLEYRQELLYDFHNASESIIELFRHILRGVCQDNEKTKIIKNLSLDSTFAVFDWGQKIVPQRYREPQREYYGKKGLSILVGSFVVRNGQMSTICKPNDDSTTTFNDLTTTFNHLTTTFNDSATPYDDLTTSFNKSTTSNSLTTAFNASTTTFNHLTTSYNNSTSTFNDPTTTFNDLATTFNHLTTSYNNSTASYNNSTTTFNDSTTTFNHLTTSYNNSTPTFNDSTTTLNHLTTSYNNSTTSYNNSTTSYNNSTPTFNHLTTSYNNSTTTFNDSTTTFNDLTTTFNHLTTTLNDSTTAFNDSTTTTIGDTSYITSTYIVALTFANQNELDTLSATQLIIEKFHKDYPYIKYIFKRSDNASNFSSHSTAEAEYLICKKVNDLNTHVLSNQHETNINSIKKRSTNDAARLHLMASLKTVSVRSKNETTTIIQQQTSASQTSTISNFSINKFINSINCEGWALRVRKPGHRISQEVKDFIEKIWNDSFQNGIKLKPESIHEKIRRERNDKNEKLFKPEQYVSVAQIKYQIKKLSKKYGVSTEQQLTDDLLIQTETAVTTL
ncbi:unnamed protein product [Rotaria sordida]|uniref:Uncharacterized protein n=1 Tax=Rotaria sordida TaxID=392033 RepID=A0A815PSP8_9BILA|nr:unnamed protein product [Rotaria sordida]